jgi:hypothetical protein
MKKIIFIPLIIISLHGCKKDDNGISKFETGTYSGEKTIYYSGTHYESVDTITIRFENNAYSYTGSYALDYGRGNYLIKNNSVEFNNDEARIALYTWDWILGGIHKFRMTGDSLILNQSSPYIQISCRLKRTTK